MRNIFTLAVAIMASVAMMAQTTVTWTPTQGDVTALTDPSVHVVTVGTGSQSFQVFSTRPFFNNNAVKLEWDASENAIKMTDNGIDKAGLAIYVPSTSDNISNIVVYMHTSNTRKTLYASGNPCPSSGTATAEALAKTSTGYTFWSGTFSKDVYYACGGRSGGSGDSYFDKIEVTFTTDGGETTDPVFSVTLLGPDAIYVGQKASFGASPDVKADAFKWTVDGIEQGGATSALFEYSPAVGTYAIQAFAKNEYNSDWVASNIINLVVSEKTELEQVPVTAATVWDWTKAGTGSIEWKEDTTPRKDKDTVLLANVEGINNNAEFNSQALLFAGQYPIREGKYCQGPWISFKTTVAGYVQVEFSNTGSKTVARYVAINGVVNTTVGTLNTTKVESANIPVEAGDVVIEGSFDPYESQYLRIYKITFSTDAPPAELSHDATLKSLVYGSEQTSVPDFSPTKYSYEVVLPSDYVGGAPSIQAELNDEKAKLDISQATSLPGTASAKVTAEDGTTKTYTVAFSKDGEEPPATIAVTGVTLDKSTLTLKVGQTYSLIAQIIPSDATNQKVSWNSSNTAAAIVSGGVVTAKAVGSATITVKTDDGGFEEYCNVTVKKEDTPTPPVPQTDLTIHYPGVYEEVEAKGGYGKELNNGYEVFYAGRWDNGGTKLTIHVTPEDKSKGITKNETNSSYEAIDGWFKGSGTDKGTGFDPKEEFAEATSRCHTMTSSDSLEMHISGYDQFSLYAADKKWEPNKPANCKYFKVSIDDVPQTMEPSTSPTIRRFDLPTSGEHVIKISLVGDGNLFGGFSLHEAQVPSVKYLKGNDSTQVVLQTEKLPRDVVYYTKYNIENGTQVIWEDQPAKGIDLIVKTHTNFGDTLLLTGVANCPVGVYPFHVSSFDENGNETKRLPSGKITVKSDIQAMGDTVVEVYEGESMDALKFRYYALSATDVNVAWKDGNKPNGINEHGENGTYTISGTPTPLGDYPFTISVKDGNSLNGLIKVLKPIGGDSLVLYLYTNGDRETILEKDGVAKYIKEEMKYKFVPQKAQDALRSAEQYQKYKWVLISENANANNEEVLALTKQSAILPVLNMKAFTYAEERLSWGDPDNGSLTGNGRFITVRRDDHPIFQTLGKKQGDTIHVIEKIDEKGLMPIDINLPGTHCLATSLPRAKTDYYGDGKDPYTFLHEVPAGMRGGKKYICLPIAMSSSKNLTTSGKKLIKAIVDYLLNDEPSIQVPQLQITSFVIDGIDGKIDQSTNKITFEIDLKEHFNVDKFAVKPTISWADETYTHVTPTSGEAVDFSESWGYPVAYEVSDYINRRVYEVAIRFFNSEGIEDVYAVGDWVNIYDIFGRKVSTTNEDVYHMVLPRGVYVIVTETGQTFKIMR